MLFRSLHRFPFAVLANGMRYDGEWHGSVNSRHRTEVSAKAELERRQRVHRKANPNSELDLRVVRLTWVSLVDSRARGV